MVELCFLSAGVYGSWRMTGRSRWSQDRIGAGFKKDSFCFINKLERE